MALTGTGSKSSVSFHNVGVSYLNDEGEANSKFACEVTVVCEYDPEVRLSLNLTATGYAIKPSKLLLN